MPLEQYRRKRDFAKTPEPSGDGVRAAGIVDWLPAYLVEGGRRYVVGRHRATRLHYDLRLEVEGVLVSWAVPKGPTLDPTARRIAIHVEDHPLEYLEFEDVIPRGEYGAGDAIVWDWGHFEPEAPTLDVRRAIDDGEVKFSLEGEKLKGRFTIVRTGRRGEAGARGDHHGKDEWLLIHKRDAAAVPGWDAEDYPRSVKTGRKNEEVAAGLPPRFDAPPPAPEPPLDLGAAVEAPFPGFIPSMAATLASGPFQDPDWVFEVKWDGFRVEAVLREGLVRIYTRNGNDAATYFPNLLSPPEWSELSEAVVDGEVVALDDEGRPDFGILQTRLGVTSDEDAKRKASSASQPHVPDAPPAPLLYEAFDLMYAAGHSLLRVPLVERKRLLRRILHETTRVRYAAHVEADGVAFFGAAAAQGLEGIMAKHRRSPYEPGRRTTTWLKLKVRPEQEFVVGGFLPGRGHARDLGALLVGVYEDSRLRFCGRVGSGFDDRTRRELRAHLEGLVRPESPFDPPPPRTGDLRNAIWVDPVIVARVAFSNWTRDGLVRQPSFEGLEPEKDPGTVTRERAVPAAVADRAAEAALNGDPPVDQPQRSRASGARATQATAHAAGRAPSGGPAIETVPWLRDEIADIPQALEALERLGREGVWTLGGRQQKLTNLDKVLFPPREGREASPITKRELIRYFVLVGPTLVPHLAERALNIHRFPDGATGEGFWQKDLPPTAPSWLRRWRETGVEDRKPNVHLVVDSIASLAWLGNQAGFEFHPWTSRIEAPDHPTFALIDIDPGERTTWDETLILARLFRTALGHLNVDGCPKATGKRGLQVWIPIEPRYTFQETSAWVERLSRAVGAAAPDLVSWAWSKEDRQGRARLDYTQNSPIRTLVGPYAVRPSAGAPVSAPITWDELDDPALRSDRWTIRDMPARVEERGDLFARALVQDQRLPELA